MSEGRVDQSRHQGRRTIHMYDFETGESVLLPRHRRFLHNFAAERHNPRIRWNIVGLASRAGNRTAAGRAFNEHLSWARARAVEAYVLRANLASMGRGGVQLPTLNTRVIGVGTRMSDVEGTSRNDAFHRGVMIFNGTVEGAGIRITGRVPFEPDTEFHIKYCGSGSGGLVLGGNLSLFAIRDPRNYWQRYTYAGLHGGVSAPVTWGEGLPAGEGWVEFQTSRRVAVDDFGGNAEIIEGGAQAGSAGFSTLTLRFGRGFGDGIRPIEVTCPTGPGFSLGGSASLVARLMTAGERTHSRRWRNL